MPRRRPEPKKVQPSVPPLEPKPKPLPQKNKTKSTVKKTSIKDPMKVSVKVPNAVSVPIRAAQMGVRAVTHPVRATRQAIQNKVDATKQSFQNMVDSVTLKDTRTKVKNTARNLKESILDRLSPKRMFNRLREQVKSDTQAIVSSEIGTLEGSVKTSFALQNKVITDIGKDVKLVRKDTTDIKKTLEKSFKELNKRLNDFNGGSGSASSFFDDILGKGIPWKKLLVAGGAALTGLGGMVKSIFSKSTYVEPFTKLKTPSGLKKTLPKGTGKSIVLPPKNTPSGLTKTLPKGTGKPTTVKVPTTGQSPQKSKPNFLEKMLDLGKKTIKNIELPKIDFKLPGQASKAIEIAKNFKITDIGSGIKQGLDMFKTGVIDKIDLSKIATGKHPAYLKFARQLDEFNKRLKIPHAALVGPILSAIDPIVAELDPNASDHEVRKQIVGAIASLSGAGIGGILGTFITLPTGPFAALGGMAGATIGALSAEQGAELLYDIITGEFDPLSYFKVKKWEPSLKTGERIILPEMPKPVISPAKPKGPFFKRGKTHPKPKPVPSPSIGGSSGSDDLLGSEGFDSMISGMDSFAGNTEINPTTKALEPFKNRIGGIDSSYGTYLSDQRDQMPSMYGSRFAGRTAGSSAPGYGPGTGTEGGTESLPELTASQKETITKLTSGQTVNLSDQSFLNTLSSDELKALGIEKNFDEDVTGKKKVTFKSVAPIISDEEARKSLAISSEKVGAISAKYEGKVDTVGGDGGRAYGKYQFDYKVGGLQTFFKDNPDFAKQFEGLSPGTSEFNKKWKEVAAANPTEFEAAQDKSAKNIWFNPAKNHADSLGFKTDNPGIREAIFSGAIQHGGIKEILSSASKREGFADMSAEDQIKAFYAERSKYVEGLTSLDSGRKTAVLNRYKTEEVDALKYASRPSVTEGATSFTDSQINEEKNRLSQEKVKSRQSELEKVARKSSLKKDAAGTIRSATLGESQGAVVDRALKTLGMNENRDREAIKSYLKDGGVNLDPAVTAWCAAFINSTLKQEGYKGSKSQVATSFSEWGTSVDAANMKKGDILVEHRGRSAGQTGGHVGMATGESRMKNGKLQVEMLGGNQGNSVTKKWVDAEKLNIRRADESVMTPELIAKREEQFKKAETVVTTDSVQKAGENILQNKNEAARRTSSPPQKTSSVSSNIKMEEERFRRAAQVENKESVKRETADSLKKPDPIVEAEEDRKTRDTVKPESKPTDSNVTIAKNYQASHPDIDPSFKKTMQKQTNNPVDRKQGYAGVPIPA